MKKVVILPLGSMEDEVIIFERVEEALADAFSIRCEFSSVVEVPDSAFNQKRGQYRSPDLLKIVAQMTRGDVGLGITELDIYSSNLNFVFGQASSVTDSAVLSLRRLRPSFYGSKNEQIFMERVGKEAVHEVGHVLGLSHCKNSQCVMCFSNNIASVDEKGTKLCVNCYESF